MLREFIFLGTIAFTKYCNAQELLPETASLILNTPFKTDWYNHENEAEQKIILEILKDTSFHPNCHEEEAEDQSVMLNSYRLIDLNSDKQPELVFSGFCQPYAYTVVYAKTNGKWQVEYEKAGSIVHYSKSEKGIILYIFLEACCCLEYNTLRKVSFEKSLSNVDEYYIYHTNTEITRKPLSKKVYQLKNIGLRTEPKTDDTPRAWICSDDSTCIGNVYASFKQARVHLIETTEIDKQKWLLVCVYQEEANGTNADNHYPELDKTWYLGWLSIHDIKATNKKFKL